MNKLSDQFDYTQLSVAERILLAEEIWDSIAAEGRPIALTEEQKRVLDHRIEDSESSSDQFPTWDEVQQRLQQ